MSIAVAALLGACSAAPPTAKECVCTFGGKTYRIVQNTKGAVYGVPVR